ncbi:MAG: cofactor-independent phosphoglycerate mutase [Syntrophales bacterium]|nr:cofactor-independent phosphoglycerate mutase [Syntrophales bacterium]MDD5531589.1 cofactor-independent phosphoglycerate mutase [Syntrophales bacterium]
MKYAILIGDGMADYPLDVLGGGTPLSAAATPNMDMISSRGSIGLINTIPAGFPPGSDVANLTVLGYDPAESYTGRGPLEAASLGVRLSPGEVAFRCNLVTLGPGEAPAMEDYSAGHISTGEAKELILALDRELGAGAFRFYPGVGYRHLLVCRGGGSLKTTPPHDIVGRSAVKYLPAGEDEAPLRELMRKAREILEAHPVNASRLRAGENPANSIWPWGQGTSPRMTPLTSRYNIRGGIISAVDLLRGIGVLAGLEVIPVEGATGYIDTNYAGKAAEAVTALHRGCDLVIVHVEAPDEMGHEGKVKEKMRAIEDFDAKVVGPVLREIALLGSFRLLVLSDHPTPIVKRTHVGDPSPFCVLSSEPGENRGRGMPFTEKSAAESGIIVSPGHSLIGCFLGDWGAFVAARR